MIFNESLSQGIFPTCMKLAEVVPLFKSKDRRDKIKLQTYLSTTDSIQTVGKDHLQGSLHIPKLHQPIVLQPIWV